MLLLLIENERYIPYFNIIQNGLYLKKELINTNFGELEIWKDFDNPIAFIVIRGQKTIDDVNMPLSVVEIISKLNVKAIGLLCKVGGINSLLRVGDILLISDYLDITFMYQKTCGLKEISVDSLNMSNPFCSLWRESQITKLMEWRATYSSNIFTKGTFICTQGPSFESKAEAGSYRQMLADVVGHSLSPYVYYAKQLFIPYSVVTIVSNTYGDNKDDDEFVNNDSNNTLISSLAQMMISTCPHINLK